MKVWKKSILDEVIGLTQKGQKVENISEKDIERLKEYIEDIKKNNEEINYGPENTDIEDGENNEESNSGESEELEDNGNENNNENTNNIPNEEELEKMELEELKELAKLVKVKGVVDSFKDKSKLIERINEKR